MIDFSIIIVTYNSERFIASCLSSILQHRTDYSYEIIVVDNDSQDMTKEIVQRFDSVNLIENKENQGFSKANNIGIMHSKGRYTFLLNPDVHITDHCVDQLTRRLNEDDSRAIVAPKLVYSDGSIQESARRFPNLFIQVAGRIPLFHKLVQTQHNEYLMKDWNHSSNRDVDWVIGAAILAKKEDLIEIGMFDEDFFLYCEDIDLCYRFYKRGYKAYYDADVTLIHEYQKTSRKKINRLSFLHLYSIIKFYAKHPELLLP
jgi:N-acetylglucosaminyl-diphospho-decaprenol L-rhamnosyltransferase